MRRAPAARYTPPHQRGAAGDAATSDVARTLGDVSAEGGAYLRVPL